MEKLLNSEQLADVLGVSVGTLHRWARLRQGPPFIKIVGQRRYRMTDVQDWLKQSEVRNG